MLDRSELDYKNVLPVFHDEIKNHDEEQKNQLDNFSLTTTKQKKISNKIYKCNAKEINHFFKLLNHKFNAIIKDEKEYDTFLLHSSAVADTLNAKKDLVDTVLSLPFRNQHSLDKICCYTVLIWTSWLSDIICNYNEWFNWTNNIVDQINIYTSILHKDETYSDSCQLKFDDWLNFHNQFEEDLITYRNYNTHVFNLCEKILSTFSQENINFCCCQECLKSKLISNENEIENMMLNLVNIIGKCYKKRLYLNNIVEHVKNVSILYIGKIKILVF